MESLRAIRSPSALFDRDAGRRASRAMTALMATPLARIEDYSGKGIGLGGAMSGRFDGKPSTIGNTSKYTPAHDLPRGIAQNAHITKPPRRPDDLSSTCV